MATRTKPVTPFQQGQSTNEHPDKTKTAKVKANMSSVRNSGTEDSLHASLGHRGLPLLPSDNHIWTHTTRVEPVGAHYSPAGEFGARSRTGAGRGVYSYGGAPNRKGENAVGNNSNRKGQNAVGNNSNRKGDSPLGRAMNRVGTKSGYAKFKPTGNGKNV